MYLLVVGHQPLQSIYGEDYPIEVVEDRSPDSDLSFEVTLGVDIYSWERWWHRHWTAQPNKAQIVALSKHQKTKAPALTLRCS